MIHSAEALYEIQLNTPSPIRYQTSQQEYNQISPSQKIQQEKPQINSSKILTLAQVNKNNKIQLIQSTLQKILYYSKEQQLLFCGVLGSSKNQKSILLDNIVRSNETQQIGVKEFQESPFSRLTINRYPVKIADNKFLFFIHYSEGQNQKGQMHQKLMDMLIMLSNSIVMVIQQENELHSINNVLLNSSKRLSFQNYSSYWPENSYTIHINHNHISNKSQSLSLFKKNLFLFLNKDAKKTIKYLMKSLSQTINIKTIKKIRLNVNILFKMMLAVIQDENDHKKNMINMGKIEKDLSTEIHEQYLKFYTELYDLHLQNNLSESKTYTLDNLFQLFTQIKSKIYLEFDSIQLITEDYLEYKNKLDEFIDQKQRLIIQINRKKQNYNFGLISQQFIINKNQISLQKYQSKLQSRPQFKLVLLKTSRIRQILVNMDRSIKKYEIKRQKYLVGNKQQQINISIKNKSEQYQKIMKQNQQIRQSSDRQNQLTTKILKIKRQLYIYRKKNVQHLQMKEDNQYKMEELLKDIRQLQEKQRQNIQKKKDIQNQYSFNGEKQKIEAKISKLQKVYDEKKQKMKDTIFGQVKAKENKQKMKSKMIK